MAARRDTPPTDPSPAVVLLSLARLVPNGSTRTLKSLTFSLERSLLGVGSFQHLRVNVNSNHIALALALAEPTPALTSNNKRQTLSCSILEFRNGHDFKATRVMAAHQLSLATKQSPGTYRTKTCPTWPFCIFSPSVAFITVIGPHFECDQMPGTCSTQTPDLDPHVSEETLSIHRHGKKSGEHSIRTLYQVREHYQH